MLPYEFCHNLPYFGLPMRWRYSMSSPVSLFKTAARTSMGRHQDMSMRADIECCHILQQDSIASCVVLNVLLGVHMAGTVGGSSSCVSCCWGHVERLAHILLRVCMVGPSSYSVGGSWARRRRRARRAAFCSSMSARSDLRAARRVGCRCGVVVGGAAVLAAFRGLGDRRGGSRRDAVGVVGTLWRGAISGA